MGCKGAALFEANGIYACRLKKAEAKRSPKQPGSEAAKQVRNET